VAKAIRTAIPRLGSIRVTVQYICNGGSIINFAENVAPTQSGLTVSMNKPFALMPLTDASSVAESD
jgi:hypothetical protein